MKKTLLILSSLFIACTVNAGPNEGVVLTVHGNTEGLATDGDPCNLPIPTTCAETVPTAQPDPFGVEWFNVLVARAGGASFNTITFGVGPYDPGACYIATYGPCRTDLDPLEIPSQSWPGPFSGTAVSWAPECLEGTLVQVYWFGVYAYTSGVIPLGSYYPNQRSSVVSCEGWPVEDFFVDHGSFGCGGAQGDQTCPDEPTAARETTWGRIKALSR
jgi:hypothetical protein